MAGAAPGACVRFTPHAEGAAPDMRAKDTAKSDNRRERSDPDFSWVTAGSVATRFFLG